VYLCLIPVQLSQPAPVRSDSFSSIEFVSITIFKKVPNHSFELQSIRQQFNSPRSSIGFISVSDIIIRECVLCVLHHFIIRITLLICRRAVEQLHPAHPSSKIALAGAPDIASGVIHLQQCLTQSHPTFMTHPSRAEITVTIKLSQQNF
jgi:hypothetical protein